MEWCGSGEREIFFHPGFKLPADFFQVCMLFCWQILQVLLKELVLVRILFLYTVTPLPRFSMVDPLGKQICYLHL